MIRGLADRLVFGCLVVVTIAAYLSPIAPSLGSAIGHTAFHFVDEARAHARWAGTHDLAVAARALEARSPTLTEGARSVELHAHGQGSAPHSHSAVVDALLVAVAGDGSELRAAPSAPPNTGSHLPPPAPDWDVLGAWSTAATRTLPLPPPAWQVPPPLPPPRA